MPRDARASASTTDAGSQIRHWSMFSYASSLSNRNMSGSAVVEQIEWRIFPFFSLM